MAVEPLDIDLRGTGLIARVQVEFLIHGGSHGHWLVYLTGNEEEDLKTLHRLYRGLKQIPWKPWGEKDLGEELRRKWL